MNQMVMPKGFSALVGALAAQKAATLPQPKAKRIRLLDAARAAVSAGALPPVLEFQSEANYSYNRHAAELHKLAKAGFRSEVEAYPLCGTNTYARALIGYRGLLVQALQAKEAAAAPVVEAEPKKKAQPAKKIAATKTAPKKPATKKAAPKKPASKKKGSK